MRLVDETLPFQVVYSIYHHEYLGHLISSHVVQLLPNGELSLVHHRLLPENMEQFSAGLNDLDRELIQLGDSISPRKIIKKFNGNPRKEAEFFTGKFEGELKKLAMKYIQRQLAEMMLIILDKSIHEMGNDGYPAKKKIKVLEEKATAWFHFRRKETFTRYYPTLKLRDETITLAGKGAVILCENPAWLLLQGELFTFEKEVDGKKLKPFLRKDYIVIPREREEEYYRKFVSQLVEKYPVVAKGFSIRDIHETPQFQIRVKDHNGNSFSFVNEVVYGAFTLNLNNIKEVKAVLKKSGTEFFFFRVIRNQEKEKEVFAFLEEIQPNKNSLTPWEYVEKDKGLAWLSANTEIIQNRGIRIVQEDKNYRINLLKPEIVMSTEESGDWFDIKAVVKIGVFSIPFIKFRNHILKGQREFILPDESIAILPEEWFSDFHHLMEVSEMRNGETISIKKYQAPLLSFPSQKKNGLAKLAESIRNLDEIPQENVPENLNATLRNYQHQGYNWLCFMKDHGMGAILADDMGLGKTLQTLSLLLKEKEDGIETPSLIVLPTSLIYNWASEAAKFAPKLNIYIHTGVSRSKDPQKFEGNNLILTTYGIVRQDINILKSFPFHYVVLDESQMIKNPDSKTAKAVKTLVSRHKLSLTGTPIENTVMDIWSQMSFLNPGLLGNEAFFKRFYVNPIEKEKDPKRAAKLQRIIYPYILRRKKQQVEKELPPKIEKLHYCDMEEKQEELYEETRSTYRNYLMDLINQGTWKKNKLNILTGLQKLRQIAIHPQMVDKEGYELIDSGKYLEVKRLLKQIIRKKRSKVLIFSQFVKMLHLLRDDLIEDGIKFNYLDGNTKDRQGQVDTFQSDKSIRAFLISLKAGGVGLNLTAADYVFILDPWWNPAVENQAIDRSHRIGQKRTVFYYKFITNNSIEEKILNLQRQKKQLSDNIIAVEEDIYKSLDAVDLEELLK